MRCVDVPERIQHRLDDELAPESVWELDRHLDGCAECRALEGELEEVTALLMEVGATPRPAPPATWSPSRPTGLGFGPAVAAMFLLGCGLFLGGIFGRPSSTDLAPVAHIEAPVYELRPASDSSLLAVSLPSQNHDVHIVWLYAMEPQKGTSK